MSDLELPVFCVIDGRPVMALATRDGGMDIFAFGLDTLEFSPDMSLLPAITRDTTERVSEERFVEIVEQLREAG